MTRRPVIALALALLGGTASAQQAAPAQAAPPPAAPAPAAPAQAAPRAAEFAAPALDPDAWKPLPADLVEVLEAKSGAYLRRALKFTCKETVREVDYNAGEAGDEKVREHEYLLLRDATVPEGFRAIRTKPGTGGRSVETVAHEMPEPYLWSALFDPRIRSTLRFQVGRWHTTPWKLAIPIHWTSSAPVLDQLRITEWSGLVEMEYGTGNVVRVVARPNLQDERIEAEYERFKTAFKFMGFSFAPLPLGRELTVTFGAEHDGFAYPSRVELVTFRQRGREAREIVSRRIVEYSEYKFFGTAVEERIPPLDWNAPPGAPPVNRPK